MNGSTAEPTSAPNTTNDASETVTCSKCKLNPGKADLGLNHILCAECLFDRVSAKIRGALRSNQVITIGDTVAVAYSGGANSTCLVHCLTSVRSERTDRPEKQKIAFGLRILHIDDSAVNTKTATSNHQEKIKACVEQYCTTSDVTFSSYPLEDIYEPEIASPEDRRTQLQQVLQAVTDPTGREDLIHHLRTQLLLLKAKQAGCQQLLTAECASTLAARLISGAVKGCGYGLVGQIQMVDSRYGSSQPFIARPMRDVSRKEVDYLVDFKNLPTAVSKTTTTGETEEDGDGDDGRGSKNNINVLSESFIDTLLDFNPGAVNNIMSAMSKLQAFDFNDIPLAVAATTDKSNGNSSSGGVEGEERKEKEVLCPICSDPLADDELFLTSNSNGEGGSDSSSNSINTILCQSCREQIVGRGGADFIAQLPVNMRERMEKLATAAAGSLISDKKEVGGSCEAVEGLRAQIADYLLE